MRHSLKRLLSWMLVFCMVLGSLPAVHASTDRTYTLDADLFRQDVFEYFPGSGVWLLDTQTTALPADVTFYSEAMDPGSLQNHDLNGDGITNAADADFLLEYVVGNEPALKAEGVISGDSRLDPGIRAQCTISTFRHEKTLRAIIRDGENRVWMSEFDTDAIPDYTRLTEKSLGIDLASATMGQDGWLYAASIHLDSMRSDLYRLDPETFAATRVGSSADAYVDLAPAPGAPGNSLMAVYGGNVLHVNAETGDYYNWYYMFSNNSVGAGH